MTKVSIVGAGNAGCFSALEYSWQSKMDKWRGNGRGIEEIELIHDSSINPELAGQATFPPRLNCYGVLSNQNLITIPTLFMQRLN